MKLWPFSKKRPQAQSDLDRIDEEKAIEIIAGGLGLPTLSGPTVNERTGLRISTVYRCVALMAGTLATLPCEVYERVDSDERRQAWEHPAWRLLHDEPNVQMSAAVFWEAEGYDYFLRGNAYALIDRNRNGVPQALLWLPASQVEPQHNPDHTRIWYRITLPRGRSVVVDQDDILHVPNLGWDGLKGRAPLECARESIGLSLAQEEYSAKYFGQGVSSEWVLTYPKKIDPDELERLKDYLRDRQGGLKNAHLPLILANQGKAENLNHSPEDSQLVQARTFQAEDICRFFGVPPHMAMVLSKTTSWGTGITEQTIGFVKFSLRPHVKKFEQEVNRKLLRDPRFFCKFNLDALLRADPKSRAEMYKVALGGTQNPAYMTPNEVRRLEQLPPHPDGDELAKPKDRQGSADTGDSNNDPADPRRWMKGGEHEGQV